MSQKKKLKTHRLILLTWKEVEDYLKQNDRIIFPIGSTEQHGPKALMGTDHLVSENIALELGKRTGTIVAPTLNFGMSEHHMAFPGTMSFSKECYYLVLYNLLTKLSRHGFKRVLLINGHGGNCRTVNAVRHQLKNEIPKLQIAFINWWDISPAQKLLEKYFGKWEGHHATPGETSIMMYNYSKMISNKKIARGNCPSEKDYEKAKTPEDFKKLFPDGVWYADPNLASGRKGKVLQDVCIHYLATRIKKWQFKKYLI